MPADRKQAFRATHYLASINMVKANSERFDGKIRRTHSIILSILVVRPRPRGGKLGVLESEASSRRNKHIYMVIREM